jgi:hypothetical protein
MQEVYYFFDGFANFGIVERSAAVIDDFFKLWFKPETLPIGAGLADV